MRIGAIIADGRVDRHRSMLRRMTGRTIVIVGSPTALGGHFGGHGA